MSESLYVLDVYVSLCQTHTQLCVRVFVRGFVFFVGLYAACCLHVPKVCVLLFFLCCLSPTHIPKACSLVFFYVSCCLSPTHTSVVVENIEMNNEHMRRSHVPELISKFDN